MATIKSKCESKAALMEIYFLSKADSHGELGFWYNIT